MRPARLWGTAGFRLVLLYAVVFAACSTVLFAVVHWGTVGALQRQIADAVSADFTAMEREQVRGGTEAIAALLHRQEVDPAARPEAHYGLFNASSRRLAGDLGAPAPDGWSEIPAPTGGNDEAYLLARAGRLPDGALLVVAHEAGHVQEIQELLLHAFLWAGGATLLLGLGGGVLVARGFLRRVDAIAATAEAIAGGELDRRVPVAVVGPGAARHDEMDRLAAAINAMLDRIRNLMAELQHASSAIAHDLRTPLARLRQGLEDARARAGTAADYEAAMDTAIAETDAVLRTFAALLRIAQVESGSRHAGFARVDLSATAEGVAEAYGPSVEDSGRHLATEVTPGIAVQGDQELLTQMLSNLLENAIRHTPQGSHIAVRLARTSGSGTDPVLVVEDDGPGIPEADRARVLRRFHRLDPSRSDGGSGLGLALVAAVADLHGAELGLTETTLGGRGLRVAVCFPAPGSRRGISRKTKDG